MTKQQRDALEVFFKGAFEYGAWADMSGAEEDARKLANAMGWNFEEQRWATEEELS